MTTLKIIPAEHKFKRVSSKVSLSKSNVLGLTNVD